MKTRIITISLITATATMILTGCGKTAEPQPAVSTPINAKTYTPAPPTSSPDLGGTESMGGTTNGPTK